MLEGLRERMGRRALEAATLERTARPLRASMRERRVLLVLPTGEDGQRAVWPFVADLDMPLGSLTCVVCSDRVAYAPDRFAGSVQRVADKDLDWRGLPRAEAIVRIQSGADVAVDLAEPESLPARFLVGTSAAAVRIGPHGPEAERYYDLMLLGAETPRAFVRVLGDTLRKIEPPILPLR